MTSVSILKVRGNIRIHLVIILLSCALPIQIMGRAAIAGTLVLATFCFLSLPQKSKYLKQAFNAARHPMGLTFLIVAIFWLPNIAQSIDPVRSLEAGVRTFFFLGVATLFWSVLAENKKLHGLFCRTFVIASAVAILIALIAEIAVPELYWFVHFEGWRDIPIDTSLKSFASLSVLMIPALFWMGYRLRAGWTILAIASSIGFIALVVLTNNRSAVAGLIAMILVVAFLLARLGRSRIIQVALPLGALAIFSGVIMLLYITRHPTGFEGYWYLPIWLVDFQRQSIWRFSFELLQQNFWFGMGINTINFAPGADAVIPSTQNLKMIPSHPHNWIMEIAVETGVFGLLALLGSVAASFNHMIRKFLQNRDNAYLITICISVGYWVSGLFNFSFWSAWWQMSFMLIIALCLSQKTSSNLSNNE